MFVVQYDEQGNITGTVQGAKLPIHDNQLTFLEWVDTNNKKVDLETMSLVDLPRPEDA